MGDIQTALLWIFGTLVLAVMFAELLTTVQGVRLTKGGKLRVGWLGRAVDVPRGEQIVLSRRATLVLSSFTSDIGHLVLLNDTMSWLPSHRLRSHAPFIWEIAAVDGCVESGHSLTFTSGSDKLEMYVSDRKAIIEALQARGVAVERRRA